MKKTIDKATAISALKEIMEWANNYPDCLSERTDYARGYKQGIVYAKYMVRELLAEYAGMVKED